VHEFRAYHRGVEVEIFQINGAAACTLCGNNAVETNLDCDHVGSGGNPIPGIHDAFAADSEASAIGICLFTMIVDAHAPVCDVVRLVDQNVVLFNEDDRVGALTNAWDALGKVTGFDCVGLAPGSLYLGLMRRWHISMRAPVSVLRTALRILQGNCRQEA
jgi:hypothetical protein